MRTYSKSYFIWQPENHLFSIQDLSCGGEVLNDASSATGTNISVEEWPGEFDFRIDRQTLSLSEKEKASDATYSPMLDKLFCDINKCFSIRFTLGKSFPNPPNNSYESMTIRAMLVYTAPGEMANPVIRCPNHQAPEDPINQKVFEKHQHEHVIWSAESNAFYDRNTTSGRLSVITPFGLPHIGSNYVAHVYKFTCIGSCAGGINRRATSVVFTLEQHGQILGRQSLSCRICSCPKRDRKAQESALMKQSMIGEVEQAQPMMLSPKKKLKLDGSPVSSTLPKFSSPINISRNNDVFSVPIYGYDNYIALSKFAEYLDSTSGALKNSDYRMHRAQMIMEQQQQRDKSNMKPKAKEYPELDLWRIWSNSLPLSIDKW